MRSTRLLTILARVAGGLATSAALGATGCYAGAAAEEETEADVYAAVEETAHDGAARPQPVGEFRVRMRDGATDVVGTITDGPEPEPIVWRAVAKDGACALLEPETPFCETACDARSVCTADDTCTRYPEFAQLGPVYLSGISEQELTLSRANGTYTAGDTPLAFAPCSEGDPLRLRATGEADAAFILQTRCIAPLELDEQAPVEYGHALALTWKRAVNPEHSRVRVRLDLAHLGGSKAAIACDTADTGRLTIASSLIDGLLAHGSAGLPTMTVTRIARSIQHAPPRSAGAPIGPEPKGVTFSMQHTVERCLSIAEEAQVR